MSSCFRTSPIITPAAGELRTPNAERGDSVFSRRAFLVWACTDEDRLGGGWQV